jgi:hypothetical protein
MKGFYFMDGAFSWVLLLIIGLQLDAGLLYWIIFGAWTIVSILSGAYEAGRNKKGED